MNSRRLPGKVLKNLDQKTILEWTINRLKKNKSKIPVCVITSKEKSDDPIDIFCKKNQINCYRGSLNDVLKRFCDACNFFNVDFVIRISGDSPLIDHRLIDKAYQIHLKNNIDLISNILFRTYPKGQSVEIISKEALNNLDKLNLSKAEREHVTLGFYKNQSLFKIKNFESEDENYSHYQLSIDTYNDYKKIANFIKNNKNAFFLNWKEICSRI
tara:strand:+ start:129 stop:770 length:642 start_codon:yes stop_codon:yes gene_type:complete